MTTRYIWAIGVGLLVGLIAGCEDKNNKPVTVAPTPAPPAPYAEPALPPSPPPTPPPTASTTPPGDTYNPPVDTTPIPPEGPAGHQATGKAHNGRQAPHAHYAPAPKSGRTYTVKKGDTLGEISQKVYGTSKKWRKIYEANKGVMKGDPKKLAPGMKLVIPK